MFAPLDEVGHTWQESLEISLQIKDGSLVLGAHFFTPWNHKTP